MHPAVQSVCTSKYLVRPASVFAMHAHSADEGQGGSARLNILPVIDPLKYFIICTQVRNGTALLKRGRGRDGRS